MIDQHSAESTHGTLTAPSAHETVNQAHTHDPTCPKCPGGHGRPSSCDHSNYSRRRVRFIQAHREAYDTAYTNPDPHSASNELERLDREYKTLPPRHSCSCDPLHCALCRRLAAQRPTGPDVALEIGRGSLINAPCPLTIMLDLYAGYAA